MLALTLAAATRSGLMCAVFTAILLLFGAPLTLADMLGHGGMVRALAVAPDGKHILTGSFDYSARVWDFEEQKSTAVLEEHFGPVNAVAFMPDGTRAVTASDDGTLILWDIAKQKPLRHFKGHKGKAMSVAVSPDGRLVASGSWDRTVRLWDSETGKMIRSIPHTADVTVVRFLPDGETIITGARDGALRTWRTSDGAQLGTLKGHAWVVAQVAVSPSGKIAISASTDATVRLWDLTSQKEIATLKGHEGPVYGVAFSPDGKLAISGGRDGTLVIWNVATRAQHRVIQTHVKPVWAVAFSRDGRFVLSAGSDGAIRVWHAETGDRIGIPGEGDAAPKPWLESKHPGARLYRKCAACHSLSSSGPRRSGPHFAGLFGRRAGTVIGYKYSDALHQADVIWNERSLFELFNKGPDIFMPGTKMPVQRIPHSKQLHQLIDYMRELTATTKPVTPAPLLDSNRSERNAPPKNAAGP
jgi:cytochrome c